MIIDLPLIFFCWLMLFLWQLVGFPVVYKFYFKHLADAGWGTARLVTWLIISLTVWFLAHLGLPVNQPFFIYFLFFMLGVFSLSFYWSKQKEINLFFKKNWKIILAQELVFLFFFFFLSIVRGYTPRIEGLEKFMDVGFMAAYLRSPTLPIEDMWLAGTNVNYYTFGHFLGAVVTQFWNISVDYSYNLLLGMIMGLVAVQAFSLVANFVSALFAQDNKDKKITDQQTQTRSIMAGALGAVLLVFAGNGHATWYWLTNRTFEGYWYPNATRFIENTIHEFPAYSFIVSDLHAHVWAIPIVLFIILNIFLWLKNLLIASNKEIKLSHFLKQKYVLNAVMMGVLLGLAISTSTWDFLIYGLLLGVIGLMVLIFKTKQSYHLFFSAVVMAVFALITTSPWLLNFDSISEGVRLVQERSPMWQLLVLWTPHVIMTAVVSTLLVWHIKLKNKLSPLVMVMLAMAITSIILLILPEIFYMKDIYPTHPRANTMFKLTFQAFVMMTLLVGCFSGIISWLKIKKKLSKVKLSLLAGLLLLFVLATGYYSYFGYRDYYVGLKNYQTLDGLDFLQKQHPDDYLGINWLRHNVDGRPVVLEAVGESYTTFARVSSFTGLPTVLGWRVHEWLWRGGFDIPGQRTEEVRKMYEEPSSPAAQQLFQQYKVRFIFLGDKEREAYENMDEAQVINLGKVVFNSGNTYIIEL
jgi:uncharacterized membrane protein